MIKVVIATCNRPEMLRTALQSVADQTICSQIGSVVVSENGGNHGSEGVCAEFSNLPINYFFRDPPIPPIEHARILFSDTPPEKYTAILHDDDWWAPRHLENAYNALESNPHFSATFSNYFASLAPRYPYYGNSWLWFVWAASPHKFHKPFIELDSVKVLIACLLNTAFHYSSVVGRSMLIQYAINNTIASGNLYDNDRIFPVYLAEKGPVYFLNEATCFVRQHVEQDSRREEYRKNESLLKNRTLLWMQSNWPGECKTAAQTFNKSMENIPIKWKNELSSLLSEINIKTLIDFGFNIPHVELPTPPIEKHPKIKWLLHGIGNKIKELACRIN